MTAIDTETAHRILVIDDNFSIHEAFQKILIRPEILKSDSDDMEASLFDMDFIHIAEECGLIVPIGEWVLRAPRHLEFEVTESFLENDFSAILSSLDELRSMDIRIVVDDFGNGYSNIRRLKKIYFDCIKIDLSSISNIDGDVMNRSIVSAILARAKAMNVRVVAEGVETTEQVDWLSDM